MKGNHSTIVDFMIEFFEVFQFKLDDKMLEEITRKFCQDLDTQEIFKVPHNWVQYKYSYFKKYEQNPKPLGAGGFGSIYLITMEETKEVLAKKVVDIPPSVSKVKFSEYIDRDMLVASICDHKNLIKVYYRGYSEEGNYLCFMELVKQGSLRDLIDKQFKEKKFFPEETLQQIMEGCIDGLEALNDLRMIHLDIKPENILMTEDGTPKYCDFGITQLEFESGDYSKPIGTEPYMHPKMYFNRLSNNENDRWALGLVFYELITLRFLNPF